MSSIDALDKELTDPSEDPVYEAEIGTLKSEMTLDEALAALKLRDDEVAWLERELEGFQEGRRIKLRSTANERAWLVANKHAVTVNVNAYTLALDLAESLEAERDQLQQRIDVLEAEVVRLTKGVHL